MPAKACHDFNNVFTLFTAIPVLFITIYEVVEQPLGKLPAFKIQSQGEGDDKEKVLPRNLLIPLFSDPWD